MMAPVDVEAVQKVPEVDPALLAMPKRIKYDRKMLLPIVLRRGLYLLLLYF